MQRFENRKSNNKKKINVLNQDGSLAETKIVEIVRDSSIEGVIEEGTHLDANIFNELAEEVNECKYLTIKRMTNTGTGQNGTEQTFTIPLNGIYHIKAAGAHGGKGAGADTLGLEGGKGAIVEADFMLNAEVEHLFSRR